MADMWIRDVPDADVSGSSVAVSDLARLAELTADLADPDVMDRAWR